MKTNTLGKRLYALRHAASMTIPELSEKSDVASSTISDAENDKTDIRVATLVRMLDALGKRGGFRL